MLCFCTNISHPFKLSSSSIVEEVAILSFKSVAGGEKQGGLCEEREKFEWGGSVEKNRKRTCDIQHEGKNRVTCGGKYSAKDQAVSCQGKKERSYEHSCTCETK